METLLDSVLSIHPRDQHSWMEVVPQVIPCFLSLEKDEGTSSLPTWPVVQTVAPAQAGQSGEGESEQGLPWV